MTSVLRTYAQIPARIRYFTVLADISGYIGTNVGPLITETQFVNNYDASVNLVYGSLLKDMGRSITVYDDTIVGSPHIAIYRQVQLVDGATTEGVGGSLSNGYQTYYILTWSADGNGVYVARTG